MLCKFYRNKKAQFGVSLVQDATDQGYHKCHLVEPWKLFIWLRKFILGYLKILLCLQRQEQP